MKSHQRGRLALAASAVLLCGCYHYVQPGPEPIPQGTRIRLLVSPPRSFDLASVTVHDVGAVVAEMIREDNGDLVVSARWFDATTGAGYDGGNRTFRIPRSGIGRVEVRRLSPWRTAAVLAGGFVATYFGFHRFTGSDPGSGTSGGGNPTR